VADEISSIGESATPNEILDKARDENTELHKCFEWNDGIAAERWRLHQARQVVCCLVVKETDDSEANSKPAVRMFYKTNSEDGYKPTSFIVQNKSEYERLLQMAFSELKAFQTKYAVLSELEELFGVIDNLAG
jgi:hypothetical protein